MEKNDHVAINLTAVEGENAKNNLSRRGRDLELAAEDAEPLVPTAPPPNRPAANPENDSDETPDDDVPYTPEARPGVDDGFFPPPAEKPTVNKPQKPTKPNGSVPRPSDDAPIPNFPYAPDFGPNIVNINGVPTQVPDVNVYQHKKTLAQGMMDLALLSANANQLRYVLESYKRHPYYYVSLIFIVISLAFQVAVGVGLILNSRFNVNDRREICKANKINNLTVIGIFLITIVNVFISAFGVADPPPDMNA